MLKIKQLLILVVLLSLAGIGSYFLLSRSNTEILHERMKETTRIAIQFLQLEVSSLGQKNTHQLLGLSQKSEIKQFFKASQPVPVGGISPAPPAMKELVGLWKGMDFDLIWLLDKDGKILYSSGGEEEKGETVSGIPVVKKALEGELAGSTSIFKNVLFSLSAVPVYSATQETLGVLFAGKSFTAEWLRDRSKRLNTHLALFAENTIRYHTLDSYSANQIGALLKQGAFGKFKEGISAFMKEYQTGTTVNIMGMVPFSGELQDYHVGLIVHDQHESLEFLPFFNRNVQAMLLGLLVLLTFGFLISLWIPLSFKSYSRKLAGQIATNLSYSAEGSTRDFDQYITELKPIIETIKSYLAQDRKRSELTRETLGIGNNLTERLLATVPRKSTKEMSGVPNAAQPKTVATTAPAEDRSESVVASLDELDSVEIPPDREEDATEPETDDDAVKARSKQIKALSSNTIPSTEEDLGAEDESVAMTQTIAIGGGQTIPDDEEVYFDQVYKKFLDKREELGETATINREKFIGSLRANSKRIREKFGCEKVKFTVFEKAGKASVKGAPVRN